MRDAPVDQVDRLVRQVPVWIVAVGECSGMQRLVGDLAAVAALWRSPRPRRIWTVSSTDGSSCRTAGSAAQRGVTSGRAVLVQCGRADRLQLAAGGASFGSKPRRRPRPPTGWSSSMNRMMSPAAGSPSSPSSGALELTVLGAGDERDQSSCRSACPSTVRAPGLVRPSTIAVLPHPARRSARGCSSGGVRGSCLSARSRSGGPRPGRRPPRPAGQLRPNGRAARALRLLGGAAGNRPGGGPSEHADDLVPGSSPRRRRSRAGCARRRPRSAGRPSRMCSVPM